MTPLSASFPALGTTATVVVTDAGSLGEARALLERELAEVDLACSRFRPDSELAQLSETGGSPVQVSALLAEAVAVALDAAAATGGLVDPTLGAQLRAAGYDRSFELVRERDAWHVRAAPVHEAPAWPSVRLDVRARTLAVPPGVELDLGATTKAWAADRAAGRIVAELGGGALVSLGGDIAVAGSPPPLGWAVRIADDHAADPADAGGPVVAIHGGGLATSSTASRRWTTDRGEAHHILDPRSGGPADTPWRTVTVAGGTCVDANVASTAAVVLGDGARDWLTARGLPARLVRRDGAVLTVGEWPAERSAA